MNVHKYSLLYSASFMSVLMLASPAQAQEQTAPPAGTQPSTSEQATVQPAPEANGSAAVEDIYGDEGNAIVVTGVRRGAVIGDIPPENTLNSRDIRATGATSIDELLDAIAPQTGSARGRGGEPPILLLNGQRISSFREIRDIPPEAIERLDILPEEVALKYGYSADQRVVNIVLRRRFRSTAARLDTNTATEGGYIGGRADVTRLTIQTNGRTTYNVHAEANSPLAEDERNIAPTSDPTQPDDRSARTLVSRKELLRGSMTVNRTIFNDVGATLNSEIEHNASRSLFGLSDFALDPLVRNSNSDTIHLGFTLNGDEGKWHWSSTGNGDVTDSVTHSDRRSDATPRDRANSFTASGDIDLTANGPLFKVPAGDASATFKVGGSTIGLDSKNRIANVLTENDVSRTIGIASANFDLPISRRNRDFSALGNLSLNANAEIQQLSDFGSLTAVGAGLNWSPVERLNLITSWTQEEGAPSIQQLGDPILTTPETRVFDFTTGKTVLVTSITGGNPDLLADRRNVVKVGANWKPLKETDLNLRAEYVHQAIDRPISSFPGVTAEIEKAFPERFFRDPVTEELISVDFRPVNYDQSRRDTIRFGFDFSKPLTSARPSQAVIERLRAQRGTGQSPPTEGSTPPAPRSEGGPSPGGPGAGRGGGGFGGGFGRFGPGGRQGGRLQFSITDTITLVDEATIRSGVPELDYLHGDALGSTGGRPRHQVEAQAGYFNNGLGARISANWRSGTHVDSENGDHLDFSPLATFDLRLFANLGERLDLVSKHSWLRGSSVHFAIDNVFDAKPRVHDDLGDVPNNYQADLLDPIGRTVMISFRKLFLPPPGFFRRQENQPPRSSSQKGAKSDQ